MTESGSNGSSDRLDRIEENLFILSERVGELAQSVSDLRYSVNELRQGQAETKASIDLLVQTMTQFQQQAMADHAVILDNQAEIRRIWEYLMRENPNGRGGEG